jgi:glyceraldehyde-3-phosphate dehydrogenase type I
MGPTSTKDLVYAIKYDTLMGPYTPKEIIFENNILTINGHKITILTQADPAQLLWKELGIDWVIDASGKFTKRELAEKHLQAGAQKILITAPATDEDVTIIPGVNNDAYKKEHKIVSLGSCTTNALVPTLHVLRQLAPLEHVSFTTIHAYTNTQVLLDVECKSTRLSRTAGVNMIPTSTGATLVVGKVIHELDGKIIGNSVRVPLTKVSLIDVVAITKKALSKETINQAFEHAQQDKLKNILSITYEPLVSSDFNNNPNSVIIDGSLTQTQGTVAKIFGWYDNEWAYSLRLLDFLEKTLV